MTQTIDCCVMDLTSWLCFYSQYEIIDSAWLIITRKHPELLQGPDGKPFAIRRNHNLHNAFIPKQPAISPYRQWTSMNETAKIIFGTSLSGQLNAIDSFSSILLSQVKVLPADVADDTYYSPPWIAEVVQNMETMVITVCTGVIYQVVDDSATVEAAAPGKKGGGKKGAPVVPTEIKPEKKKKCFITVASMTMGTGTVISPGALEVVDTITVDLAAAEDDRHVTVDVFTTDSLVSVTTSQGGCNVYPLPQVSSIANDPNNLVIDLNAGAEEKKDSDNLPKSICSMSVNDFFGNRKLQAVLFAASTDEYAPALVKRAFSCSLLANADSDRNHATSSSQSHASPHGGHGSSSHSLHGHGHGHGHGHSSSSHLHGGKDANKEVVQVTPEARAKQIQNLPLCQLMNILCVSSKEMVAIFEDAKEWSLVDMHKLKKSTKPAAVAPASTDKAKAPPGKSKKVEEAPVQDTQPQNPNGLHPTIIGTWKLPSAVSQFKVDERRASLLLGLVDGTVSLWDLRSRTIMSVLCQHRSPVTSLCFCSNPVNNIKQAKFIASGSSDGILCFHSVQSKTETVLTSTKGSDIARPSYENPLYTANGLTFRNDVSGASVLKVVTSLPVAGFKYPVCVVYYSDETIALYDYETAQLLGQLKYGIQRSLTDPVWHPATLKDILAVGSMRDDEFDSNMTSVLDVSITEEDEEEDNEKEDDKDTMKESGTRTRIKSIDAQYKLPPTVFGWDATESAEGKDGASNSNVPGSPTQETKEGFSSEGRQFSTLCCFSHRGICGMFVQDNRQTNDYIDIRMDDLILQGYPALQAVCSDDKRENLPKYFQQLSKEERTQQALPRERVSEILGLVDDRFPSRPGGKGKKGTSVPMSRTGNGAVGASSSSIGGGSTTLKLAGLGAVGGSTSGNKLLETSIASSNAHLPVKQWAGDGGKEAVIDDEHPLSARSNDSSISANIPAQRALGSLDIDTAEYGDAAFQFDPVHAARRAAALNKHNRLLANVGSQGALHGAHHKLQTAHTASSLTTNKSAASPRTHGGTAHGKTVGGGAKIKHVDPVLVLLNGLADHFK
jgi:hypothetical protein